MYEFTSIAVTRDVDHEADRLAREREAGRQRKLEANERQKLELELARQRKQQAENKTYNSLFDAQKQERREKEAARTSTDDPKDENYDSEEDFM